MANQEIANLWNEYQLILNEFKEAHKAHTDSRKESNQFKELKNDIGIIDTEKENGSAIPIRFVIGGMMCLACIIYAIIQSNMSIIILAMTTDPYDPSLELPDYGIRYEWSSYDKSLVIGSYFWGITMVSSFSGVLAERYSPRKILGFVFAMAAILSSVSPVGAQFLWLAILIRFLTGTMMGMVSPSLHALIANWAPPEEKGIFVSLLIFNGVGTVIDWSMSGHIIEQYGWKYAFYVVSLIFGVFTIFWLCIVYDSPRKHPRITVEEKDFILSKLSSTRSGIKKRWPPFRSIISSIPFWALLCFRFGDMCGFYFLLTSVPRYLSEVHKFSITKTGFLASVPYLARVPFGLMFGYVGDLLIKRNKMSRNAIRKWFSICSHLIPGFFLICITFVGDQEYVCLAFITIALCFNSAVVVTSNHNAHDLAPNFASTIYGLITFVGSTSGYLTPLLVAYFTKYRSSEEEWQKIFFFGAGMYIGSATIFILFGSGYTQKWNNIPSEDTLMVTADDNLNKINKKMKE